MQSLTIFGKYWLFYMAFIVGIGIVGSSIFWVRLVGSALLFLWASWLYDKVTDTPAPTSAPKEENMILYCPRCKKGQRCRSVNYVMHTADSADEKEVDESLKQSGAETERGYHLFMCQVCSRGIWVEMIVVTRQITITVAKTQLPGKPEEE